MFPREGSGDYVAQVFASALADLVAKISKIHFVPRASPLPERNSNVQFERLEGRYSF
jgi:hypothetical protein